MPASVSDQLMALVQSVRIKRLISTAGASYPSRVVSVQLSLPEGADPTNGLTVFETVTNTNVEPYDVNFAQLTKNVRFDVSDVEAISTVDANTPLRGGLPIASVSGQVEKVTLGSTQAPGLPGSLGTLRGQIPVARAVSSIVPLEVAVDVRWSFRDENSNISFDVDWQIGSEPRATRGRGGEVNPDPEDVLKPLNIALPIAFVERADEAVSTSRHFIHASVRLIAGGISTPWIDVPRVEVHRLVVEVPTLLMVFSGKNYAGASGILVPGDSTLSSRTQAISALEQLRDTLEELIDETVAFPPPLTDLTPALNHVTDLIAKVATTNTFVRTQESRVLKQITLVSTDEQAQPVNAEEQISSLMMIGPPGRRVRFFNTRDLIDGAGQMYVTCGPEMFAAVADLDHHSPASVPQTAVTVVSQPRGRRGTRSITTFDDAISSLKFEA